MLALSENETSTDLKPAKLAAWNQLL